MYKAIEKQQPVMEKYADELVNSGVVTKEDYKVCTWGSDWGELTFHFYSKDLAEGND